MRGHGDSAPRATCPPGAPAGAAATAPAAERAGSGSRLPAAPGPPGASLLPGGETPTRREDAAGARASGVLWAGQSALGVSAGPRLGHKERARSGGVSERWELRGGPESRGNFRGKRPDPASWAGGGSAAAGAPRFRVGEGGAGPGQRGGAGSVRKGSGEGPSGKQDWTGAASTPCALRIPVVPGQATARARETHPELESVSSKERRLPPTFGLGGGCAEVWGPVGSRPRSAGGTPRA